MQESIRRALLNISRHGDTDVFPFPFERYVFSDLPNESAAYLQDLHDNFGERIQAIPPAAVDALTQVGYTGFRRVTQIEPFWNAYYLALVIEVAELIEVARLPVERRNVFSYRYDWNEEKASLFQNITWTQYRTAAYEQSQNFKFVVQTDIADYYPRVNHHKIQNLLQRIGAEPTYSSRIMQLLSVFSQTLSYGLPIGGPASRILAEFALLDPDQHLATGGLAFCRYADDYTIFCDSKADAYRALIFLSEKLFNERLTLQKQKTKILSTEEFAETHRILGPAQGDDRAAAEEQKLLAISIRFDPYSPTAEEDYEALKDAVAHIDLLGILSREIAKTRIDTTVTKQALNALKAGSAPDQATAVRVLLELTNLEALAPVFVTVMRTARAIYDDLPEPAKQTADNQLVELYASGSHLLSVELNLSYFIQLLAVRRDPAGRKEQILVEIYGKTVSPLLKRQIIAAMANWRADYFLSDTITNFATMPEYERRVVVLASYARGEAGKHWRQHNKQTWSRACDLIKQWYTSRNPTKGPIPL